MTLLGKSGTELNTIIDAGSEAFKALGDEAEEMGYVMSDEAVSALGSFNDKLQQLKAGLSGLKNAASLIALPFLDDLAAEGIPILAEFTRGIQDANGDVTKMADVIGEGLSKVLNLIIEKLPEFVEMGVTMVASLLEGIVSNAPTIATAAVEIVNTLVKRNCGAFARAYRRRGADDYRAGKRAGAVIADAYSDDRSSCVADRPNADRKYSASD